MRARRRAGWAVALVAVVVAAGCSRCGRGGEAAVPVERLMPKGAVGVVLVPSVGALGQKLSILQGLKVTGFAAQLQGFASATAYADALVGELGVDVRSPAALEQAGLDGARAAGAAVLITGHAYLVLPVKDAGQLHAALERLASRRLGAAVSGEERVGALTLKTFRARAGAPPRLGYVLARGYALVASDDAIGQLVGMASIPESDALSGDAALAAAKARLPGACELLAWLPPGSPLLGRTPVTSALVTAGLAPTGLTLAVDAPWKGAAAQLAGLEPKAGPDLLGLLPRDAFLALRFQGDPQGLAPLAAQVLGPNLSRAFAEAGFDVKAEVLDALQPGAVAALSLAERPPMDRGLPSLDLRQTNPFTYAHLSGAAALRSQDAAWATLGKVAALAPRFGAQMQKAERDGRPVLLTTYAQGEGVHLAVKDDRVLFGSPVQRLDALAAADGAGGAPVPGLGDGALAVAVDLSRLSQSVRALPESAWGIGGFAIKATTVRWLDATDDLKAVTLSVSARERTLQARLALRLGAAAADAGRGP